MTPASVPASRSRLRGERPQRLLAALISALLHVLMLLLLLHASRVVMKTASGAPGGSRMRVDFLGQPTPAEHEERIPLTTTPQPQPRKPIPRHRRASTTPVQSTLVTRAEQPLPPPEPQLSPPAPPTPSTPALPPVASPGPRSPNPRSAAVPADDVPRRPETWTGRPPGMLERDTAPENTGPAARSAVSQGYGRASDTAGPGLEAGGYLVYYDLRSETLLREWKARGMTEVFFLLPGTDQRMICPLEVALRRGSGECRLLPPDSPELKTIGDAREVITMMDVYHRGERVWQGPGAYR